jgi:hypothetical protein
MRRNVLFWSLAVVLPAGFYTKFYRGPAAHWVNDSLDGVLYEIFWCLVWALLLPRAKLFRIALCVLIATCGLEFLQLWHPPFLEMLRSHFLGAAILGTTFDWLDFPHYIAGCSIGWLWLEKAGSPAGSVK